MFFYKAYGLLFQSEVTLCELPCGSDSDNAVDVVICRGSCTLPPEAHIQADYFQLERESAHLFWKQIGTFRVRRGREIVVESVSEQTDDQIGSVLLGAVLPVLLLQRGLFVLHASAVALRSADGVERAVAFLGHSGQGKSTMATALHRRGHRALADDTIALPVPESEAPLLIHPALPHLKLRAPSVEAFGENAAVLPKWSEDDDSYLLRLSPNQSREPAPLRGLYVLEESATIAVERLEPAEALMYLMRHAYSMGLLPDEDLEANFDQCVRIARHVPVFKLRRPKDFRCLPDVVRLVEEHQESLLLEETARVT